MQISEIEDPLVRKAYGRLATMLEQIQEGQRQILSDADAILEAGDAIKSGKWLENFKGFELAVDVGNAGAALDSRFAVSRFLQERHIGKDDTVSTEFLELGIYAKRPVGRVSSSIGTGTGLLIGLDLMMTAAHVVPNYSSAEDMGFDLGAEENLLGLPLQSVSYHLDPSTFYWRDTELDLAVVALRDWSGTKPAVSSFGWHHISGSRLRTKPADPVNIIQHPSGGAKKLAMHNSKFLSVTSDKINDQVFWYTGDTLPGSSGAPVFDNDWQVAAIHQQAVARVDSESRLLRRDGSLATSLIDPQLDYIANQGLNIRAASQAIKEKPCEASSHEPLRQELIAFWEAPGAGARSLASRSR
jgi:V8-like Glu-specific endopeptidase